jgi:hypothetical protein
MPSFQEAAQERTAAAIDARGIIIPIFGSEAEVTIVGQGSLERLAQIIAACEGRLIMLGPEAYASVWLVLGRTDIRKSINGLSDKVANQLKLDAMSGQYFVLWT